MLCARCGSFGPVVTPGGLRPLVGGKAREALNVFNWADLFRCAATINTGKVAPNRILRKLADSIGRQGKTRDRKTEGQHYRIAGFNLSTAIIID